MVIQGFGNMEKILCNGGKAITPIFRELAEDPTLPELIGSGVLVRFGPAFFLFTAAHVLDHAKASDLLLPSAPGKMVVLNGRGGISVYGGDCRKSDHFDCGWVQLSSEMACAIGQQHEFLDVRDLLLDDNSTEGDEYCLSGYPVQRSKLVHAPEMAVGVSLLNYNARTASGKTLRKTGADPNSHLVVHHSKGKVFDFRGKRQPSDDPEGMSGGAIWKWVADAEKGSQLRFLSGIIVAKDVHNAVIVGTKIAFVIESIRAFIPELSPLLPRSNSVDILCQEPTTTSENPSV